MPGEWDQTVTLDHAKLRVEAVYRYDNPGSVTLQDIAPVDGAKNDKARVTQQLLRAHLDSHGEM